MVATELEHELPDTPPDAAPGATTTRSLGAVAAFAQTTTSERPPPYEGPDPDASDFSATLQGGRNGLTSFSTLCRSAWTLVCVHRSDLVGWFAIVGGFVLAVLALVPAFVSQAVTEKQYKLDKWQALKEFFDYCKEEKAGGHVPKNCEGTIDADIPLPPDVDLDNDFNRLMTRMPRTIRDTIALEQPPSSQTNSLRIMAACGISVTLWAVGGYLLHKARRKRRRHTRPWVTNGTKTKAHPESPSESRKCWAKSCEYIAYGKADREQHMAEAHGWDALRYLDPKASEPELDHTSHYRGMSTLDTRPVQSCDLEFCYNSGLSMSNGGSAYSALPDAVPFTQPGGSDIDLFAGPDPTTDTLGSSPFGTRESDPLGPPGSFASSYSVSSSRLEDHCILWDTENDRTPGHGILEDLMTMPPFEPLTKEGSDDGLFHGDPWALLSARRHQGNGVGNSPTGSQQHGFDPAVTQPGPGHSGLVGAGSSQALDDLFGPMPIDGTAEERESSSFLDSVRTSYDSNGRSSAKASFLSRKALKSSGIYHHIRQPEDSTPQDQPPIDHPAQEGSSGEDNTEEPVRRKARFKAKATRDKKERWLD